MEAQRDGALLSVVLQWECPAGSVCVPRLQAFPLADDGFSTTWASYHRIGSPNVLKRDLHQSVGLRLLVTSRGTGTKIELYSCFVQLFVALALIPVPHAHLP